MGWAYALRVPPWRPRCNMSLPCSCCRAGLSDCWYWPGAAQPCHGMHASAGQLQWVGALASLASYGIALWAMTQASVVMVAALREVSVLFAVLIGVLVLREVINSRRVLGALMIIGGIVTLRLS